MILYTKRISLLMYILYFLSSLQVFYPVISLAGEIKGKYLIVVGAPKCTLMNSYYIVINIIILLIVTKKDQLFPINYQILYSFINVFNYNH